MKHYKLRATGKVQGVWFRASARQKAEELGLAGFVRNEADGSVYLEAEGEPKALDALAEWCRQGPPQAQVEQVVVAEGEWQGFEKFEVQR